jgi:sugar lactone lactonase YvrE
MGSLEPVAEPVAEASEGLCICVRPGTNTIYVTDRKKNRGVWLYDRNGNFIRHCSFFGSKGSIQGIAVTRAGELIVSVGNLRLEHSLRLFDENMNLTFIGGWMGDTNKDSKEKITGVAVSPKNGSVVLSIANSMGARVAVLQTGVDDDGPFNFRVVRTFGQGILTGPYSVCVSDKGEFVVADLAEPTLLDDPDKKRVCIFSSEGQLLQEIELTQGWGMSPVAVRADGKIVIAHSRKPMQLLQVANHC